MFVRPPGSRLAPRTNPLLPQFGGPLMSNVWAAVVSISWFGWVAIVAIVSGSVAGIFNSWFRHRERMAMIHQGLNPDSREGKSSVPEL